MKPETDWWECPVCHKLVTPDDHCKHVYFDSHTYWGPLLKNKYKEDDDGDEASHG